MSLDVWLNVTYPVNEGEVRIPVREDGGIKHLTLDEWNARYPDREPITIDVPETEVFSGNITHNLSKMAEEAGLYEPCWRPDEMGVTHAAQLIDPLRQGLERLKADPDYYEQFNPSNGWGDYDGLLSFVEKYLAACMQYPHAEVETWR